MSDYSSLPPKPEFCDISMSDVPESSISPSSPNSNSSGIMYELMQTRKGMEELKNLVYTGIAQNSPKEGRMTENAKEFEIKRPNHENTKLKEELNKQNYEREKYQKEAQKAWRAVEELQTNLKAALAENDRNKHKIKVLTFEYENRLDRLKEEFESERANWQVEIATLKQENTFLQDAAFPETPDQEFNQLENEREIHERETKHMLLEIEELKKTSRIESQNQKREKLRNQKLEQEIEKLRREKQAVEERSETREERLMELEKEIGVERVAKCAETPGSWGIVNIKLASDEDKKARYEESDWELEFSAACKENGNGTHRLWLKCRNNSRFHAVVQQIDGKDGVIKDTKVMPSVQDGLRQLFEIKHVGGNYIRFNISTLQRRF
ncbi:Oidioi.mRNA.OKI2018_I69.chr1.g3821.t1.cds [Oikopleura dioica]|uniref:Oidioi.mRNA.OKI2018_I69.chr1.g3821.t1.cds n=1 Tax=Oikopleura dioica TaxID=34765 RepID=A0ABN7T1V3_OIKDI|nr:Oidioi.mRNA.OKI2018_I69.chr1.g3821.t1.cds [Oikopleura dioica]